MAAQAPSNKSMAQSAKDQEDGFLRVIQHQCRVTIDSLSIPERDRLIVRLAASEPEFFLDLVEGMRDARPVQPWG